MENGPSKKVTAYCPFKTFLSAIEGLEHGIPNQIDKSLWPSFSGAMQSQLLTAFRFLGLVGDGDKPETKLHEFVENKDGRTETLRRILEDSYPELIALDLTKTTPIQFDDVLREYGMVGDTNIKAKAFFVKAAKYAGIPLSPLLTKITRQGGARRRKSGTPSGGGEIENGIKQNAPSVPQAAPSSGTTRTIQLKSGGSLTISVSVNVFDMSQSDREFVFGLIDKLQAYEKGEPE
jgi:hypothetical protein